MIAAVPRRTAIRGVNELVMRACLDARSMAPLSEMDNTLLCLDIAATKFSLRRKMWERARVWVDNGATEQTLKVHRDIVDRNPVVVVRPAHTAYTRSGGSKRVPREVQTCLTYIATTAVIGPHSIALLLLIDILGWGVPSDFINKLVTEQAILKSSLHPHLIRSKLDTH